MAHLFLVSHCPQHTITHGLRSRPKNFSGILGQFDGVGVTMATVDLAVKLVVASPLRRALETALLAFEPAPGLGVLALESLREQHGMHKCDQRRDTAAIAAQFGPRVRGLEELAPTDALWSEQREPKAAVGERCDGFLRWLQARPETEVAVVSHHHLLLLMFHAVLDCGGDETAAAGGGEVEAAALLKPFSTGELRTVRLEFAE
jgi:broad specificity phosphatase PhoE